MPGAEGREVLRLLAEKKIDAEQAYRLLVALGDVPGETPGTKPTTHWAERPAAQWAERQTAHPGAEPRVLRIRVTEGGRQKVNMAVPLSLARHGRVSGLARIVGQFGIDLREVARDVAAVGKIVDVVDEDGDRVEIFVE